MKKKLNFKILSVVLGLSLFLASFFALKFQGNEAYAEEQSFSYDVLPYNYAFEDSTIFTPFDFNTEARMVGQSARFSQDEFGQFNKTFDIPQTPNLTLETKWELGLWVYFSTKNLHNLIITLSNDDGASIVFSVNKEELTNLLTKQVEFGRLDQESDGFSFNYLELPFDNANKINSTSGNNYVNFNKLTIEFSSDNSEENVEYATVYVYDVKIKETTLTINTVKEMNKQDFRLFGIDFYAADILNSVYLEDELTLKGRQQLIKYAWVGEKNVKADYSYSVIATLKNSSGEANWELEQTKEMTISGENELKIQVKKDNNVVLVKTFSFLVNQFIGISFNQVKLTYDVGKTVCFMLTKNTNSSNLDNLRFTILGDCAKIKSVDEANCCVYVDIVSVGKFTISASATVNRPLKSNIGVSCSKEFSAISPKEKNNTTWIIALSSILGIILLTGLVFGIKAIVKANKYKVR